MASSEGEKHRSLSRGPLSIVSEHERRIVEALDALSRAADSPGLREAAREVLALPREARFSRAAEVFDQVFGEEDGPDLEAIAADATVRDPVLATDRDRAVYAPFDDLAADLADRTLERVLTDRESLVFVVFLERFRSALDDLEQRRLQGEEAYELEYRSRLIALFSHLVVILAGERDELDEAFLRDVYAAEYYGERWREDGSAELPSPDEYDFAELRGGVLLAGAVRAYRDLRISVSRGAELAECSVQEFEAALEDAGVEPRYGPETAGDLHGAPDLRTEGDVPDPTGADR